MAGRKSIGDATAKSFSKVKALLKERGITVEAVDGPSQDDKDLRFLQELQQIERALESENSSRAENPSLSLNLTGGGERVMQDTMDKASKGKGL
jgi:hypothetical protein